MFDFKFKIKRTTQTAICMTDTSYSIATLSDDHRLLSHEYREFTAKTIPTLADSLISDAKRLHLIGQTCRLILTPQQYQLVMMDALDVPETEMAKALKWRLKGLIDYPLNDIAMDAFLVPPHGVANQQKKAFVAVTPLSKLRAKLALCAAAYIDIVEVGITELALGKLCSLLPLKRNAPIIVISPEGHNAQLHIFYHQQLYLVRALHLPIHVADENSDHQHSTLLEIQRSMDHCQVTLKLPEPQAIYFTPGFGKATVLLHYLEQELQNLVHLIDLNELLSLTEPLSLHDQQNLFYSIGGALTVSDATTPLIHQEESI